MREPLVEYRLTLGDVETRALELEGDGPPLVLLHGRAGWVHGDAHGRRCALIRHNGGRPDALAAAAPHAR